MQPFIAFSLELQKYGHRVKIATHETHRKFVEDRGIQFFPIAGDPKDLMKLCVDNGMTLRQYNNRIDMFTISFMKESLAHYVDFFDQLVLSTWNAVKEDTDVIIQNPPAFTGVHMAEKLGVREEELNYQLLH